MQVLMVKAYMPMWNSPLTFLFICLLLDSHKYQLSNNLYFKVHILAQNAG